MSRRAPIDDPDLGDFDEIDEFGEIEDAVAPPAGARDRRSVARKRDLVVVGVMTPALLIGILVGVLVLGRALDPDPYVPPAPTATPGPLMVLDGNRQLVPAVPSVVALPIDAARLNRGIVEQTAAFDWPTIDDLKIVPDTGRPTEYAEYKPSLAAVDLRRLIDYVAVTVILHNQEQLAQAAADELAKAYPLDPSPRGVLDLTAATGYTPDGGTYGVVFAHTNYRIHIEAVAASPPIRPGQRAEIESHTLHLADHIARRVQEVKAGIHRTGPEATAVHWRDHLARRLPFGQ